MKKWLAIFLASVFVFRAVPAYAEDLPETDGTFEDAAVWLSGQAAELSADIAASLTEADFDLLGFPEEILDTLADSTDAVQSTPLKAFTLLKSDYMNPGRLRLTAPADLPDTYDETVLIDYIGLESLSSAAVGQFYGSAELAAYSANQYTGYISLPETLRGTASMTVLQYEAGTAQLCTFDEGLGNLRYALGFLNSPDLYDRLYEISAMLTGGVPGYQIIETAADRIDGSGTNLSFTEPVGFNEAEDEDAFLRRIAGAFSDKAADIFTEDYIALFSSMPEITELLLDAADKSDSVTHMIAYHAPDLLSATAGYGEDYQELIALFGGHVSDYFEKKGTTLFQTLWQSAINSCGVTAVAASSVGRLTVYESVPETLEGETLVFLKNDDNETAAVLFINASDGAASVTCQLNTVSELPVDFLTTLTFCENIRYIDLVSEADTVDEAPVSGIGCLMKQRFHELLTIKEDRSAEHD